MRTRLRVVSVVLVTLGVLLSLTIPASAATSQWIANFAAATYNAGDHDMTYGPNSFTVQDRACGDQYVIMVWYSSDLGSGTITGSCSGNTESIAPLGPTAHPLRWRLCWVDLYPHISQRCGEWIDDTVYRD